MFEKVKKEKQKLVEKIENLEKEDVVRVINGLVCISAGLGMFYSFRSGLKTGFKFGYNYGFDESSYYTQIGLNEGLLQYHMPDGRVPDFNSREDYETWKNAFQQTVITKR